jgi:hypothetical protein
VAATGLADRARSALSHAGIDVTVYDEVRIEPADLSIRRAAVPRDDQDRHRCQQSMPMTNLKPGWAVVTDDGRRIGRMREVGQHSVALYGLHFSAAICVPASAIAQR